MRDRSEMVAGDSVAAFRLRTPAPTTGSTALVAGRPRSITGRRLALQAESAAVAVWWPSGHRAAEVAAALPIASAADVTHWPQSGQQASYCAPSAALVRCSKRARSSAVHQQRWSRRGRRTLAALAVAKAVAHLGGADHRADRGVCAAHRRRCSRHAGSKNGGRRIAAGEHDLAEGGVVVRAGLVGGSSLIPSRSVFLPDAAALVGAGRWRAPATTLPNRSPCRDRRRCRQSRHFGRIQTIFGGIEASLRAGLVLLVSAYYPVQLFDVLAQCRAQVFDQPVHRRLGLGVKRSARRTARPAHRPPTLPRWPPTSCTARSVVAAAPSPAQHLAVERERGIVDLRFRVAGIAVDRMEGEVIAPGRQRGADHAMMTGRTASGVGMIARHRHAPPRNCVPAVARIARLEPAKPTTLGSCRGRAASTRSHCGLASAVSSARTPGPWHRVPLTPKLSPVRWMWAR